MADHPAPPYEAAATDMYGQPTQPAPQSRNIYATQPISPPLKSTTSTSELPPQPAFQPTPMHHQQSGTVPAPGPAPVHHQQQPQPQPQHYPQPAAVQEKRPAPAPAPSHQYHTSTPLVALNRAPAPVDCPVCHARALTRTEFVTGNTTHAWALGFCCFTLLFCIPYMINSFKDVSHHCGSCGVLLATWHRSGNTEVHQHA
ncbi:LPS-induced tumor necrosis factor alpha factor [Lasallia pustulata]|uniref:LPS-induced tumor necrosis factor alpha factor n=1 Tax=Lasallia pustulata TaxID=136370 RepID=A0A1W5D8S5_9LECA|nr:LPS-induced tumor necrosis factor alpha factor [Lasallia pustulata]